MEPLNLFQSYGPNLTAREVGKCSLPVSPGRGSDSDDHPVSATKIKERA